MKILATVSTDKLWKTRYGFIWTNFVMFSSFVDGPGYWILRKSLFFIFITSVLQRSRDPTQLKRKSTDQTGHSTFSNMSASSFTTNSIFGCLGLKSGTSAGNIIRQGGLYEIRGDMTTPQFGRVHLYVYHTMNHFSNNFCLIPL